MKWTDEVVVKWRTFGDTGSVLVSFDCSNQEHQDVARNRADNTDTCVPGKNYLLRIRVVALNALQHDPGGHPGAAS